GGSGGTGKADGSSTGGTGGAGTAGSGGTAIDAGSSGAAGKGGAIDAGSSRDADANDVIVDGSVDSTPPRDAADPDAAGQVVTIKNGVFWSDTRGTRIEAHGGGFIRVGTTWYWIGEDKSHNSGNFKGVNCYASTDLHNWEFRRAIITRQTAPELDAADRIIERPKVIYHDGSQKYVMWLHWEGQNYAEAAAGVFSSSTIDGAYTFHKSFRPNGNMSRDDTLFKDDDGKAYFISAANENADLVIYELTADYLDIQRQVSTLWVSNWREAPAIFKNNGVYYLVTSGATGWDPNQAKYATATSMNGPWSALQNLGNNITYDSQSTYILPVVGSEGTTFIFAGDRWQDPDLLGSKYLWLPLKVNGTSLTLDYYDQWKLSVTTGKWSPYDGFVPHANWKVVYVDSEETAGEGGQAAKAFDDNANTLWHTQYTGAKPAQPHEIQIDLGQSYRVRGMQYLPRLDKDPYGIVAGYEFYVSQSTTDWGTAVATGTFGGDRSAKRVDFNEKLGRYIRFVSKSEVSGSALTSMAELDIVGSL
ncbi:MAG: family 43 glycosylhydrolase, partial [Polyangiaceae bacterium]